MGWGGYYQHHKLSFNGWLLSEVRTKCAFGRVNEVNEPDNSLLCDPHEYWGEVVAGLMGGGD